MKAQEFKKLIREEIAKTLNEAPLSSRVMTLLQPVLDGITSGTIKPSEVNSIISMLQDAKTQQTPGKGKYTITNYKNGVTVKKSTATGNITLTSTDPSIESKTFAYNKTHNRYKDPNNNSELTNSINVIVKKFADGEFN
jgi:hypothetical protein